MYRVGLIYLFLVLNSIDLHSQTFTSTPNAPIPQPNTTEWSLDVDLNILMDSNFGLETVCIDITHPTTQELTVWIIAPDLTEILLTEKNGGTGDNYTNTCFDGNTSNAEISSGTAPFTGYYLPEEFLGLLNLGTINADGTWKLKIEDDFFFNGGTLNSFSLTFGNNPALVTSSTNDECANAIQLPVNLNYFCGTILNGSIADASASAEVDNCNFPGAPFDDDIWFSFTAKDIVQDFIISNVTGSSTDLIYQVLEGNCGALTQVFCDEGLDNEFSVNNLIVDNLYYLRIASKTTLTDQNISFDICIVEGIPNPPSNDDCSGSIAIPNSGGCIQVDGSLAGATASAQSNSCTDSGDFTNDVWFSFVPTQANMRIIVSDLTGTTDDLDFQLNNGDCNNLSQVFCFFDGNPGNSITIAANNLTVNDTYYLRVASFNNAPQNTTFKICIDVPSPPPANDECAGALNIIPHETNCNTINGTITGATGGNPGINCSNNFEDYFDDDVWFKFTATNTAHAIKIFNIIGSTTDLVYEVLEGSCGSLSPIKCQDDPNEAVYLDNLTIGNTYFIRIASYLDLVQNTDFQICVGPNNLLVTNTFDTGPGSLRNAVSFAIEGDSIKFEIGINGNTILLDIPAIVIDKDMVFHNDYGNEIILRNKMTSNTSSLLTVQAILSIKGLRLQSNPAGAMKINVEPGGQLITY